MPTPPVPITSRQHAVVRALRTAASRRRGGAVVLDGAHLVADALAHGAAVRAILVANPDADAETRRAVDLARRAGVPVHAASATVIAAASPVRSPSGIVALADWSPAPLDETIFAPAPALVPILIDVQDPGNVGAIIRSADALGATGIVAAGASADPGNWKALRAAMGSTFRLSVARETAPAAIDAARARGLRIVAAVPQATTPLSLAELTGPVALLLGSEGAGLPDELARAADVGVGIPMRSGIDSLNVAMTAAILLFEAQRQRLARAVPS